MEEDRIFKNKFAYFLAIIFCFGWIIFIGFSIGKIIFKGYEVIDEYNMYSLLFYFFLFATFATFILALVKIFSESKKAFLFLNISIALLIFFQLFGLIVIRKTFPSIFSPFILKNLLIIGFGFLINYFRHTPKKNEIEEIGRSE